MVYYKLFYRLEEHRKLRKISGNKKKSDSGLFFREENTQTYFQTKLVIHLHTWMH